MLQVGDPVASFVLKVAHHGAGSGTSDQFLAAVTPRMAVISVGQDNDFGHPASDVLERLDASGVSILRTDRQGNIELTTDGDRLWVRTER
jgi:competence protein ComEC